MPPWRSARSRTQRMEASSSTSQTLRGLTGIWSMGKWQQGSEGGQTGSAFEFNQSIVATHEILGDSQAEACAVGSPSYQRIEKGVPQLIWNAGAGVFELDACHQAVAF